MNKRNDKWHCYAIILIGFHGISKKSFHILKVKPSITVFTLLAFFFRGVLAVSPV